MHERHLVVREHETIRLAPRGPLSSGAHAAFLNQIPYLPSGALSPTHDGMRTGSFCGLVQAGDWSLEILPKIFDGKEHTPDRGLLVKMLADCFDVPVWQEGTASSNLADDLLTVVIRAFLTESQKQLRQGWIKFYVAEEKLLTRPRGRLILSEQLRRGRAQAHIMHCEFDELTVDNDFNKVVTAALELARSRLPVGSSLATHADQLSLALAEVTITPNALELLERLPRHRLTQRYDRLLLLSSWLLRLLGPDVHMGAEQGLALLFDMNQLFQDYVSVSLERAIRRHPSRDRLRLTQERPMRPLVIDEAGAGRFMMMPDLCLWLDGELIAIMDTKWKKLRPDLDEHKAGVVQADMYQLLAYGHTYKCPCLSLVYPHHPGLNAWTLPRYRYSPHAQESIQLTVAVFDLDSPDMAADTLLANLDSMIVPMEIALEKQDHLHSRQ